MPQKSPSPLPQKKRLALVLAGTFAALGACATLACSSDPVGSSGNVYCDMPNNAPGASVPDGFCVRRFANVKTPRTLAFAPNGDLFVGSPSIVTPGGAPAGLGGIYVLTDDNHDGLADGVGVYAQLAEMSTVHGVLITGGRLYYTLNRQVLSVPYAAGDRALPAGTTPRLDADLSDPGPADRFTHTLAVDRAGTLYVSRGQYDNAVCPATNPRAGAVLRFGPGADPHGSVALTGCRNPMYLNCAPSGCFAAELTGDSWAGIGGEEKLVRVRDGDDLGYPCCVSKNAPVPGITPTPDCSAVSAAVQSYPLRDTPFGFDWDTLGTFPPPYKGGLFMGFHGAVGTWLNTGLRWAPAHPATHEPNQPLQNFLGGWSQNGPVVGRVADVRFSPDGRLFFSDDQAGAIYWVAPRTLRRPER